MSPQQALKIERTIGPGLALRRWSRDADGLFRAAANAHDGVELTWVEQGMARYRVDDAWYDAGPGQVMVVPTGVPHATEFPGSIRARSLHLSETLVAGISDAVWARTPRRPRLGLFSGPRKLRLLGTLLRDELTAGAAGGDLVVAALTEALVVEMLRAEEPRPGSGPTDARIRRALDFMTERYADPLTLEELAKVAGMSRYHFSRCFQAAVGRAPYQHLLELRLQHAAAVLRRGSMSVTDAALACGFPDLGRFHRAFRARFGASPGEYRRRG